VQSLSKHEWIIFRGSLKSKSPYWIIAGKARSYWIFNKNQAQCCLQQRRFGLELLGRAASAVG